MPRNLYCNVLGSSTNVENLTSKYLQNIANVWFQKSRVSSRSRNVQVSVSSQVFAQSLGLVSVSQRQCLVSISVLKILAETPALRLTFLGPISTQVKHEIGNLFAKNTNGKIKVRVFHDTFKLKTFFQVKEGQALLHRSNVVYHNYCAMCMRQQLH